MDQLIIIGLILFNFAVIININKLWNLYKRLKTRIDFLQDDKFQRDNKQLYDKLMELEFKNKKI